MYKQAILDAKAVRASAMANAKASLQEAFEPKIKEMIRLKLSEELEEDMDEPVDESRGGTPIIVPANDANDLDEEAEYFQDMLKDAGIMARVEAGIGELEIYLTNPMDKRKAEKAISDAGYTMGYEEGKKEVEESRGGAPIIVPANDANDLDEEAQYFQDMLQDAGIMARVAAGIGELEIYLTNPMDKRKAAKVIADAGYTTGYEEGDASEMDDKALEEILAELDDMNEEDEDEDKDDTDDDADDADDATKDAEEEVVSDETKIIDITLGDLKQVLQSMESGDMGSMASAEDQINIDSEEEVEDTESLEELNLDEILNSLEEAKKSKMKDKEKMKEKKEADETKKSLQEAKKTIAVLSKELNEVNLLNAKLLYMNKIFKSKNLSESQKVNVVSALDRASNVKEAKNIYETLKENIQTKKSQISEIKGFASSPAGVAPKKPIVEADAFVSRWQKIAGIK